MTPEQADAFLREAARYFENRPTGGEDSAYWANVLNAENCRKVAALIREARAQALEEAAVKFEAHDLLVAHAIRALKHKAGQP